MRAKYLIISLRPQQWIKNGFVFVPLIFSLKAFEVSSVLIAVLVFIGFCMAASSIYLINDLHDFEADRRHPKKRNRPIAAGLLPKRVARVAAILLVVVALLAGLWISKLFLIVIIIYLIVQLLYTYSFKNIVILDIFCIATGFFLRVIAGAVAIQVEISHWLIICTILISIFLSLAKRRHEAVILGHEESSHHRKVLSEYSPYLLDQMIAVVTSATLLSYMLYCISPNTMRIFNTDKMIYTFPFVLYGIFRYLYLIHKKEEGGAPEKILITDIPTLLSVLLW